MNHVFNFRNVKPPGGQIGGDQEYDTSVSELNKGRFPLHLFHAAMKTCAGNAAVSQSLPGDLGSFALIAENKRGFRAKLAQQLRQRSNLS